MKFYVIYTIDTPRNERIVPFYPPDWRANGWDQTEGNEQGDYHHLGGIWQLHHHRKFCAMLSREQFEEFLDDSGLYPEDVETMGSLTVHGWLPAISFDYETCYPEDGLRNAYVTPLPEVRGKIPTGMSEYQWQRTRKAVVSAYHW